VLALSLRSTSRPVLEEILSSWFAGAPSEDEADVANIDHVDRIS
jgi:ribose 5-phosphate isomerase B